MIFPQFRRERYINNVNAPARQTLHHAKGNKSIFNLKPFLYHVEDTLIPSFFFANSSHRPTWRVSTASSHQLSPRRRILSNLVSNRQDSSRWNHHSPQTSLKVVFSLSAMMAQGTINRPGSSLQINQIPKAFIKAVSSLQTWVSSLHLASEKQQLAPRNFPKSRTLSRLLRALLTK